MKSLMLGLTACAVALVSLAAEKTVISDSEKAALRAAREKRVMEKSGGRLIVKGKGKVAIVSCSGAYDTSRFASVANQAEEDLRVNVETVDLKDEKFEISSAKALKEKVGGNVAVFVVSDPNLPISIFAPEAGWAAMNIAALKADGADDLKVGIRARKVFARVLSMVMGSPFSANPASPMQAVTGLESLDVMPVDRLNVFDFNNMIEGLAKFGVTQTTMTTYKRACIEGWAPAPTNEFQTAIWKQYHEMPTKGLEIKYDPKKGE